MQHGGRLSDDHKNIRKVNTSSTNEMYIPVCTQCSYPHRRCVEHPRRKQNKLATCKLTGRTRRFRKSEVNQDMGHLINNDTYISTGTNDYIGQKMQPNLLK